MTKTNAGAVALALSAGLLVGCGTEPPKAKTVAAFQPIEAMSGDLQQVAELTPPPNEQSGAAEGLSPNDLILIDFFQMQELDRKMRVDSKGYLNMPLIGPVKAGGLSTEQLERELERRYGIKYLQDPEIAVLQIETKGRVAFAGGEFVRPGNVTLWGRSTLTRVVSDAGGLNKVADPKKLFVFRRFEDRTEVAQYDLEAIHKAEAKDPELYRDDVVVAFSSKRRVAVNNLKEALGIAVSGVRLATPF